MIQILDVLILEGTSTVASYVWDAQEMQRSKKQVPGIGVTIIHFFGISEKMKM
jgi:hypothetical protein